MEYCNGLTTPTKVEGTYGIYENGYDAKRYWSNTYTSVIGMMLYLESNTKPDIYFDVHQCPQFIHKTKAYPDIAVKSICRYLKSIKDKGLVFNTTKKLVVDCYPDADFAGLWGHKNLQDPIFDRSRTVFCGNFFQLYSIVGVKNTGIYCSF